MKAKTKWISIIISLLVICSIIFLLKSNNSNETILNKASKMNLYESGNKIEVIKNTERYNRILKLIVMDFPDSYGFDPPVSNEEFETIKNFSVEFELNEPETIEANTADGRKEFKVTSIIFPLDDRWGYQAYVTTEDDLNYFIGYRDNLKILVRNIVPTTN
ncbi:hypothetical protein [Paenibacillus pinihumi]|uniref:hypothetical protein n=1 Tax=Paenibacillus pinihumi TaxID=669462 RepID=UPI0004919441|nr:hypothetical protein [Paenibacillus pinihumi]